MLLQTSQKYITMIHGGTDTEHFAALYFSRLDELASHSPSIVTDLSKTSNIERQYSAAQMWTALKIAIRQVLDIQREHGGAGPFDNSLNICTSTTSSLHPSICDDHDHSIQLTG
jgi:glutamine amidotransferase